VWFCSAGGNVSPPVFFFGIFQLVIAVGTLSAVLAPGSRFARMWPGGAQQRPVRLTLGLAASYGAMGLYCLAYGLLPVTSWPGNNPDGGIAFVVIFFAGLMLLTIPRIIVTRAIYRKA
jgi:hypothetical protein